MNNKMLVIVDGNDFTFNLVESANQQLTIEGINNQMVGKVNRDILDEVGKVVDELVRCGFNKRVAVLVATQIKKDRDKAFNEA